MAEYTAHKERVAKVEMSITLVSLLPSLVEKLGVIKFKDGANEFSQKILEDENSMFCITELMPSCQGGDCYFKNLSASVFLTTLVWNNVSFAGSEEKSKPKTEKTSQTQTEKNPEAQCSGK